MNILHDKLLDLSRANLIPERLREYACRIYETITAASKVDENLQRCYLGLHIVESKLASTPLSSSLFAATRSRPQTQAGLSALRAGQSDWQSVRNPSFYDAAIQPVGNTFPYFQIYAVDNHLEFTDALRDLLRHFGEARLAEKINEEARFSDLFESNCNCFNIRNSLRNNEEWADFSTKSGAHYSWLKGYSGERFPLFNHQLVECGATAEKRPILLTENFKIAYELERDLWNNQLHVPLRRLIDDLRLDFPEEMYADQLFQTDRNGVTSHPYPPKTMPESYGDLLHNLVLKLTQDHYLAQYPLGDAIWCVPVGGFSIPDYTDWAPVSDRDIYIFKFGEENEKRSLTELATLYAAMPRSAEQKIRFVVFPRRTNRNYKENDIRILSPGELLCRCQGEGVDIPDVLLHELNDYLKQIGKKNSASPYLIEPFLRKNSWALLSGEAGVGKSYLAMAVGMAVASRGKLFHNWRVRSRGTKVLYITDDEMTPDLLMERRDLLGKIYRKSKNFLIESVRDLNLLTDGMEKINSLIDKALNSGETPVPVGMLILDHLLKLSGTVGDQRDNWPQIRRWIEELNRQGITVLLLHHEYGGARMQGTTLIANDAPARISIERPSSPDMVSDHLTFDISIPKNRGGKDQRQPMTITLVLGRQPHWIIGAEQAGKGAWKSLSKEGRRLQASALRRTMTVQEVAEHFGVSKSSIEKALQARSAESSVDSI
ncbi:MAG: AAA family ATPase [Lentisphaeria bacterium]|nr:AAA family ATPase [Lentisphaeria bacterium]